MTSVHLVRKTDPCRIAPASSGRADCKIPQIQCPGYFPVPRQDYGAADRSVGRKDARPLQPCALPHFVAVSDVQLGPWQIPPSIGCLMRKCTGLPLFLRVAAPHCPFLYRPPLTDPLVGDISRAQLMANLRMLLTCPSRHL